MTDQEYDDLWQMTEEAADRLITGEGEPGIHYRLIAKLRTHGITAMTREEAIRCGRKICDEYVTAQLADSIPQQ